MVKYRCYIVDDEPLALDVIEQHLSKFDQFEICGKSTDSVKAYSEIKALHPDLLFIDIEMPDITGLELIESMRSQPKVIITTAYREYAVESFELNVIDYLVKPIPFKRFLKAIDKFLEAHRASDPKNETSVSNHIFVRADRKTVRIVLEDILYIEGVKDYVRIITTDNKIMTKVSVGNFFKELPKEKFIRIHKSFIVAKNKITAHTAYDVEIGPVEIPIGRMYKEQFLKEIN